MVKNFASERGFHHDYSKTNPIFLLQGFTKFNFTPLEVLAIIEHVQKRLNKTFTDEEIQNEVLKELLMEEDYNIIKVVSTYQFSQV